MEGAKEKTREKASEKISRRWKNRTSFSAKMPNDVCGAFADSLCVVRFSANPFTDIRESIVEMILKVGVHDWDQMEHLVYCYIALNSPQLHDLIGKAFLSLCCNERAKANP